MRLHQSLLYRQIQLDIEKADKYQAKDIYAMLLQQVYQKQNAVKHLMVGSSTLFMALTEYQIETLESLEKSIVKDHAFYKEKVDECLEVLKRLETDLVSLTARLLKINPIS